VGGSWGGGRGGRWGFFPPVVGGKGERKGTNNCFPPEKEKGKKRGKRGRAPQFVGMGGEKKRGVARSA